MYSLIWYCGKSKHTNKAFLCRSCLHRHPLAPPSRHRDSAAPPSEYTAGLSEPFMPAYSQQVKEGAPHAELSHPTTSTLSASLKVDSAANRQGAVAH